MAVVGEYIPVGSVWERNTDHRHVVVTGLGDLGFGMADVYWIGDDDYVGSGRCGTHLWRSRFRRVTVQAPESPR